MEAGTAPEGNEILIKKYSNRRLYDTRQSKYITLEDLAALIRDGATVKVVDAKGGKDLTRVVLTQVILEEQDRLDLFPVELLHHVIKTQGTMLQGPFATFLSMAMKQFLSTGEMWERQVQGLVQGMGGGREGRPAAKAADPEPAPDEEPVAGRDEDLDAVRNRMKALLGRLKNG